VIPILLIGPTSYFISDILVDSGADDIVFPRRLATRLGIDLTGAPQVQLTGVGSTRPALGFFAPIILELRAAHETYRWRAVAAFTPTPLRIPLLGIACGLEHFRTQLDFESRELILEPKPSLSIIAAPTP
jgi:hypothetical protein